MIQPMTGRHEMKPHAALVVESLRAKIMILIYGGQKCQNLYIGTFECTK